MIFWRKKNNEGEQEQQDKEDKLLHHRNEPPLEQGADSDPAMDQDFVDHELEETESEILEESHLTPTPHHNPVDDAKEYDDLAADHTEEGGWLSRLTKGLSKSSNNISQGISDIFTKRKLDDQALEELEEVLIAADMGPKTAMQLVEQLRKDKFDKDAGMDEVLPALSRHISDILEPVAIPLDITADKKPFVILMCGVNGAGKTTTIGKMAYQFHIKEHRKVMLAAGDTFRAAAVEQLEVWAGRAHSPLLKKDIGADAASVAFESYEQAKKEGADILMIDTAGRLQNKAHLMEELKKIVRVLKKQDESIPHAVLLVLDATTGQNAHSQVKLFKEAVDVTGLIVTKLDGTAKGGVVVSLAQAFGLPIHLIGVGEKENHLSPFKAKDFADALLGIKQ